jgi:CHASE2 domain-containing sensor protein
MITAALVAYVVCAAVSLLSAVLLHRGWKRTRSRLVFWVYVAFVFLTISNVLLVWDLVSAADFARVRPALIAVGLGSLIFGLVWEQDA